MRHNFFKVVRMDKATTDDYDKANKWARNKIDVLASKDVKHTLEDHEMSIGDFCDWCKGNCCEMCDDYYMSKHSNRWQEYEWLDEWLDGDNKGAHFIDGEHKPMIKIGDKI